MPLHALDLEENRAHLGQFLDSTSLHACILVNRTWHSTFSAFLWRTVKVHSHRYGSAPLPSISAMDRYKHHIHKLEFQSLKRDMLEYFDLKGFSKMETLLVHCVPLAKQDTVGPDWDQEDQDTDDDDGISDKSSDSNSVRGYRRISDFIHQHHNTLRTIRLMCDAVKGDFWKAINSCTRLEKLWLSGRWIMVRQNQAEIFWKTCGSGLRTLEIQGGAMSLPVEWETMAPLTVREVRLGYVEVIPDMVSIQHLEWLKQCPDLESLIWFGELSSEGIELLRVTIGDGTWKGLHSLDLSFDLLTDYDMAAIISAVPRLKKIRLRSSIEPLMTKALERHFESLRALTIRYPHAVPDGVGQKVMESCPLLEELIVDRITYQDMKEGRPWVCTKLRSFHVFFSMDADGHPPRGGEFASTVEARMASEQRHQHVFGRLAKLTDLESLVIGDADHEDAGEFWLDFRVQSGLDLLKPLKRIRHLEVYRLQDQSGVGSAWMAEHWKALESVKLGRRRLPLAPYRSKAKEYLCRVV